MYCPHCGGSMPEKNGEEIKCMLCCRSNPVQNWVAEEYRRGGPAKALSMGAFHSTRTLYKMPAVMQVRAEQILDKLTPEMRRRVLEKYLK